MKKNTEINPGDIVTVAFNNNDASNTFIVERIIKYDEDKECDALIYHPLFSEILIRKPFSELNKVQANLKDSSERSLDFASNHKEFLDYNMTADLEALCAYFVIRRKLTPKQKYTLANICGKIASIKLNDNVTSAMDLIKSNKALLDEFNQLWYNNFRELLYGTKKITSNKQRTAMFNMAGFVLGELETPVAPK